MVTRASIGTPGRIRQLTFAVTCWGSAFAACPPLISVTTQVVRSAPFQPESAYPLPPVGLDASVCAAPLPGGHPPDQVREQHGLHIPRPSAGDQSVGAQFFLADSTGAAPPQAPPPSGPAVPVAQPADAVREGAVADGFIFATDPGSTARVQRPVESAIAAYGRADAVKIDPTGAGRMYQGRMVIEAPEHTGEMDLKGKTYGSVTGTLDPGPAGLATGHAPRAKEDFAIGRKTGG